MQRTSWIFGVVTLAALGQAPHAAFAADGPCTDDIAQLSRQLGSAPGLGAPVSEPAAGLAVGQKSTTTPGATAVSASDRAQPGGASRAGGGSPGTVGGVAGPVGAGSGSARQDSITSGQVATSAEDVRRQSEGKPTMAQQAASGGPTTPTADDKGSQAKMALQRAVDLNAKGDQSCKSQITEARNLMPKQ